MASKKEPIDYATLPTGGIGRRSRRLRREAFKLLIMTAILATITIILWLYNVATIGDDGSDHSLVYIMTGFMILTAIFSLASAMRFLESRAGD